MKGPKPPVVNLSEAERQGLDRLVKAHSTAQQIALRARIILTASQGLNNEQVGRELQVGVDMVRYWRQRWLTGQAVKCRTSLRRYSEPNARHKRLARTTLGRRG